jgi:GT2 family glycosyltransferase
MQRTTTRPERESTALSVVIPTSSGRDDLESCLASLAAEEYPGLEAIVVDNACPRALDPIVARFPFARVIRNDVNRGFAEACNQALPEARGRFVLLLNDDTTVQHGALAALVDTLAAHGEWGACQAKLLLMADPSRIDTAGSFLTATGFLVHRGAFGSADRFTASDEIFAGKGAALIVRREVLERVGGFDGDFFAYFEETDLCWRIWLAGWAVGFAADAHVLHRMGATAADLDATLVQFHSFKNRICTLLKNLGPARLTWMVPTHLGLCVGLAGWYSLRGESATGRAIVRAIGWNVRQLPRTLAKRRRVQSLRRVSDAELMPRISIRTPMRTLRAYARGEADLAA